LRFHDALLDARFLGPAAQSRRYEGAHETTVLWFPLMVAAVLCIIGGTDCWKRGH